MVTSIPHSRFVLAVTFVALALSACNANTLATLADALSNAGGGYGGSGYYGAQPAYGAPPTTYYPVIVQTPAPAYAAPAPTYSRNPYAVSNRYGEHRRSAARRDRSWR